MSSTALALVNATVFDGERLLPTPATVMIERGLILSVDRRPPPEGVGVIDLPGCTLLPGLTVGHWHGEYVNIGPPLFGPGRMGTAIGTEQPPLVLGLQSARALQTALMSGVTRIVSGACSNDSDWQLKEAMRLGIFDGPRLTACSRHVTGTGDHEDRGHWWKTNMLSDGIRRIGGNVFADGVDQVVKAVRQEVLCGAEIIKLLPVGGHGLDDNPAFRGLSLRELQAAVEAAHERGARVRAHVSSAQSIRECLAIGVDIIDHADGLDDACIEALLKTDATLVPSMLFTKLTSYGGIGCADPARPMDLAWDNMGVMLARANSAGVNIVPGDDFGAQGMEHELGAYARELRVYAEDMNIPAQDVLRWATINGAKLSRDNGGSVREGRDADLIAVRGDPLSDLSLLNRPTENLELIMLSGRVMKHRSQARFGQEDNLAGFKANPLPS